jgi:hypothetical protein
MMPHIREDPYHYHVPHFPLPKLTSYIQRERNGENTSQTNCEMGMVLRCIK